MRRARIVGLTLLAMAAGSVALAAQGGGGGPRWTFAAGATGVRVQSLAPTGVISELSGTTLGGSGGVALGRLALDIGYWQGRVAPEGAAGGAGVRPPARDYTEGTVLLGVQPVGWLRVRGGVQARTYVTPAGTERWVFWQVRVRAEQMILEPAVRVHGELWRAISTEVNAPQPLDRGQGGEVGLTVRLPRWPLSARLTYGIDDAKLGGGVRRETVDQLSLTIGFGVR